jgi:hypothetical protein
MDFAYARYGSENAISEDPPWEPPRATRLRARRNAFERRARRERRRSASPGAGALPSGRKAPIEKTSLPAVKETHVAHRHRTLAQAFFSFPVPRHRTVDSVI